MPNKKKKRPKCQIKRKRSGVNAKTLSTLKAAYASKNPMMQLQQFKHFCKNNLKLTIECCKGIDMDNENIEWAFQLTKVNMQKLYENSSWGWDEEEKRAQLTNKKAWFLLVKDNGKLCGFVDFRFEVDLNSPVVYCYEIQIENYLQRKGVGKHLMQVLQLIALELKFVKVMLTVFKHNQIAYNFYTKCLDFKVDETSPSDECYEILSKNTEIRL